MQQLHERYQCKVMKTMAGQSLSRSNEDYLEAILVIGLEQGLVRVKDLAQRMQVKAPSVATAVRKLAEEGLVEHESYGHVELTSRGFELAQDIHNRHRLLFRFLHDFLGLNDVTSEKDACEIEHGLSPETINRIIQFLQFMEACPAEAEPRWLAAFRYFIQTGKLPEPCPFLAEEPDASTEACLSDLNLPDRMRSAPQKVDTKTLADLCSGEQAEVIRVTGGSNVRRRLLEMGIVPGTSISIRNAESQGDPIEVVVRGFHLSLEREEATNIIVAA